MLDQDLGKFLITTSCALDAGKGEERDEGKVERGQLFTVMMLC